MEILQRGEPFTLLDLHAANPMGVLSARGPEDARRLIIAQVRSFARWLPANLSAGNDLRLARAGWLRSGSHDF